MRRRSFYKKSSINYAEAAVGDILCSDMSFVPIDQYTASGKTAIAIIFMNDNGLIRAIATRTACSGQWGPPENVPGLANVSTNKQVADDTTSGKDNTDLFCAAYPNSSYVAARVRRSYSTLGTKIGDWSLLSRYEWKVIKSIYSAIFPSLSAFDLAPLARNIWTSTPSSSAYAWGADLFTVDKAVYYAAMAVYYITY